MQNYRGFTCWRLNTPAFYKIMFKSKTSCVRRKSTEAFKHPKMWQLDLTTTVGLFQLKDSILFTQLLSHL